MGGYVLRRSATFVATPQECDSPNWRIRVDAPPPCEEGLVQGNSMSSNECAVQPSCQLGRVVRQLNVYDRAIYIQDPFHQYGKVSLLQ